MCHDVLLLIHHLCYRTLHCEGSIHSAHDGLGGLESLGLRETTIRDSSLETASIVC